MYGPSLVVVSSACLANYSHGEGRAFVIMASSVQTRSQTEHVPRSQLYTSTRLQPVSCFKQCLVANYSHGGQSS